MTGLVPEGKSDAPRCYSVAVFGSTGSVGRTCLEVLPQVEDLSLVALFAHSSVNRFVEQVRKFRPRFAGLVDSEANRLAYAELKDDFQGEWLSGKDEICDYAQYGEYDLQVAAVVGVEGLETTLPAFQAGKRIALANKESLVVGGSFFAQVAGEAGGVIVPVNSEHSSLFRLILGVGGDSSAISKIGLTASGGPFLNLSESELSDVTLQDALKHPTWEMGPRITIDSATLMNKAFEFIEAKWLFDLPPEKIEVTIHPQSIIHGYVELCDGTHLLHASPPSMGYPVAFALTFPDLPSAYVPSQPIASFQNSNLDFQEYDAQRFRAIPLARKALDEGRGALLRFYCANETAASEFLAERLPFNKIVEFVDRSLEKGDFCSFDAPSELYECLAEERAQLREDLVGLV